MNSCWSRSAALCCVSSVSRVASASWLASSSAPRASICDFLRGCFEALLLFVEFADLSFELLSRVLETLLLLGTRRFALVERGLSGLGLFGQRFEVGLLLFELCQAPLVRFGQFVELEPLLFVAALLLAHSPFTLLVLLAQLGLALRELVALTGKLRAVLLERVAALFQSRGPRRQQLPQGLHGANDVPAQGLELGKINGVRGGVRLAVGSRDTHEDHRLHHRLGCGFVVC